MENKKLKFNYLPELFKIFTGRKTPAMVSVNLTNLCNQQCVYCEIGQKTTQDTAETLTKLDLFRIIDDMAFHKIKRLSLCGGEPFLFLNLIEVVLYAYENKIFCNITSNGMTIHQLSKQDLRILKSCDTMINISVDSFQQSIQTETRGNKLALDNCIKSIKTLQKFKIPVIILSAISKYNFKDLFISLCKANEMGIQNVLYQPIISFSNFPGQHKIENKGEFNVPVAELDLLMKELHIMFQYEKNHEIKTNLYRIIPWISEYIKQFQPNYQGVFYQKCLNKFYCRESLEVIDIDYHGGIQPCGLLPAKTNIKEHPHENLLDLWVIASQKLKDQLKEERFPNECSGCCHKFGRNMLASVIKYPISNRKIILKILPMLISREYNHRF